MHGDRDPDDRDAGYETDVRDVRRRAHGPGEHCDRNGEPVAAHRRPHGDHERDPPQDRQVRVPRLGEDQRSEECDEHDECRADTRRRAGRCRRCTSVIVARIATRWIETVETCSAHPGRAQQPVDRPERDEAHGPEVASRMGCGPDPAGKADQRRMPAPHEANPHLREGVVEGRIPVHRRVLDDREDHESHEHTARQDGPSRSVLVGLPRGRRCFRGLGHGMDVVARRRGHASTRRR